MEVDLDVELFEVALDATVVEVRFAASYAFSAFS